LLNRAAPPTSSPSAVAGSNLVSSPEAIQPHGAVVVFDTALERVLQCSANLGLLLPFTARQALQTTPAKLLGSKLLAGLWRELRQPHGPIGIEVMRRNVHGHSARLQACAYRSGARIIVELDPVLSSDGKRLLSNLNAWLGRLASAVDEATLLQLLTRGVRSLIGYDRALVYEFGDDGSGTVIAEDAATGVRRLLGHRFSARDLPTRLASKQLRDTTYAVPDVGAPAVPLLPPTPAGQRPTDLSHSPLRAVSPTYARYLGDLGARASLSVALRDEYGIRALLACHARAPGPLPHAWREAVRALTEMAAQRWFLLRARADAQYLQRVQDSRDLLSHGRGELREPEAIVRHHGDDWLALFRADGLALVDGSSLVTAGRTPPAAILANIAGWLHEHAPAQGFWAGNSRNQGPLAAETEVEGCAGLLAAALPIDPQAPGWLLMFRQELRPSIRRGGPAATAGQPAAIWYEQPFGQSEPWLPIEQRAARGLAEDLAVAAAAHRISVLNVYLAEERQRLAELNRRLERQAHTDPLTGVWNRYRIEQALDAEVAAGERYGRPCTVLIFDVDHFKRINDTYGHSIGDGVLAGLAAILRETLRPSDYFGRWGGEEFIAVLSHTSLADGLGVAERLRARLAGILFIHGEHVTTSIGAATWRPGDDRRSLLDRADRALYRAKRGGRNRVCPEGNNIPRFPEDL